MRLDATSADGALTVRAPAKVNLTLRVLGRRPDGYHDLESVVVALDWFDTLTFRPADDLVLRVRGMAVPPGEDNLVLKAARALQGECGVRQGARIDLEKRIPPGRGLGGGSADAAAALIGLEALWRVGLGPADLARVGARIGSDVPFFLGPPVSVMAGRGERIEPLEARPRWWMTMAWPDYGNSTAEVYAAFDRMADGRRTRPAATDILAAVDGPAAGAAPFLVNDLERAAAGIRSDAMDLRRVLEEAGAAAVGMTGSGSAYFALADTREEARALAEAAASARVKTRVAQLAEGKQPEERPPCKSPTSQ